MITPTHLTCTLAILIKAALQCPVRKPAYICSCTPNCVTVCVEELMDNLFLMMVLFDRILLNFIITPINQLICYLLIHFKYDFIMKRTCKCTSALMHARKCCLRHCSCSCTQLVYVQNFCNTTITLLLLLLLSIYKCTL